MLVLLASLIVIVAELKRSIERNDAAARLHWQTAVYFEAARVSWLSSIKLMRQRIHLIVKGRLAETH